MKMNAPTLDGKKKQTNALLIIQFFCYFGCRILTKKENEHLTLAEIKKQNDASMIRSCFACAFDSTPMKSIQFQSSPHFVNTSKLNKNLLTKI